MSSSAVARFYAHTLASSWIHSNPHNPIRWRADYFSKQKPLHLWPTFPLFSLVPGCTRSTFVFCDVWKATLFFFLYSLGTTRKNQKSPNKKCFIFVFWLHMNRRGGFGCLVVVLLTVAIYQVKVANLILFLFWFSSRLFWFTHSLQHRNNVFQKISRPQLNSTVPSATPSTVPVPTFPPTPVVTLLDKVSQPKCFEDFSTAL